MKTRFMPSSRLISYLCMLVFLTENLDGQPDPSRWGPTSGGVQVSLRSAADSIQSGEKLRVELTIRNLSSNSYYFIESRPRSAIKFAIGDLGRQERLLPRLERLAQLARDDQTRDAILAGAGMVSSGSTWTIKANSELTNRIVLSDYDLSLPGQYTISAAVEIRSMNGGVAFELQSSPAFFRVTQSPDGGLSKNIEEPYLSKVPSRVPSPLDPGWIRKLSNRADAVAAKTPTNLPVRSQANSSPKSEPSTGPNSQTLATAPGWRVPAILLAAVGVVGYILLRARRRAAKAS